MSEADHHPSCKPDHKSLIWKCMQCGFEEDAYALQAALDQANKEITIRDKQLAKLVCEMGEARTEAAVMRSKLNAIFEETKLSLSNSGTWIHLKASEGLSSTAGRDLMDKLDAQESEIHSLKLGSMSPSDYMRLVEWLKDSERKPADLAFASGMARDAARAVEQAGVVLSIIQ